MSLQRTALNGSPTRYGATMLELVGVISIIGLLIAVLTPAVQRSREAARRMHCQSNLRQIGIAFHSYHSVHNAFPGKAFSPVYQRSLAPYLEIAPDAQTSSIFACPSDPYARGKLRGDGVSYSMSDGVKNSPKTGDGFWGRRSFRKISDITDGLSHTATLAEHIQRPEFAILSEVDPSRASVIQRRWFQQVIPDAQATLEGLSEQCVSDRTYSSGYKPNTLIYSHVVTPNGFDCRNGPRGGQPPRRSVITAMSEHVGGVNVLMADGSVHFVINNIDRSVWWSIGTRSGNEAIAAEF